MSPDRILLFAPRYWRLASFLGLMLACLGFAGGVRAEAAERFFDQSFGDLQAELAAAKHQGKGGVLLMFQAEGCPYCRRMRETVLNREEVQSFYHAHFLVFAVDVFGALPLTDFSGREATEKSLATRLRVQGTPTFIFFDLNGAETARYVGATKDAPMFLQLGRFVAEGHYRHQDFAAFLKTHTEP